MRLTTWSVTPPHLVGPNFVRPCSGHAKRRKRQEHAGRRTCSRGDGERGARRIRRGGSTRHDIEMERAARKSLSTRRSGRRPRRTHSRTEQIAKSLELVEDDKVRLKHREA